MTDHEPPGEQTETEPESPIELHRRMMSDSAPPYVLARNDHGDWTVNGDPDHPLALVRRWTRTER